MRIVTPCAVFASACLCLWMSSEPAQAQHHGHGGMMGGGGVSHHGGMGGFSGHHGGMGGFSGHHGGMGGFSGHHHHGIGYGSSFGNFGIGGFGLGGFGLGGFGFGGYGISSYSSYSSFGFPYSNSFYYGTAYPYGGYYNSAFGYPFGGYTYPAYQYLGGAAYYPPYTQPLIDAQREEEERWAEKLNFDNQIPIPIKPVVESNAQEKLHAQRLQISGDELFRKQNFSQALHQYRQANSVAKDLPGPYFRMAIVYAVQGKFDAAVLYLKRTLELDPAWPTRGDTLTTMYGDDNSLARNALLIEVSRWVKKDIRDPDRSFLMGVLLFEFDREQGAGFLEASARLSGSTRYVAPYLSPVPAPDGQNPPGGNAAPPEPPPQPDHGIPMPPVPQQDQTDEPKQQAVPGPKIEPFPRATVDLTRPRLGRVVIPGNQSPLKGPELPLLGNLNSPR